MIYIVYETFLVVPNIRQKAPLEILGSIFFIGGACPKNPPPELGLHIDSIQATPLTMYTLFYSCDCFVFGRVGNTMQLMLTKVGLK